MNYFRIISLVLLFSAISDFVKSSQDLQKTSTNCKKPREKQITESQLIDLNPECFSQFYDYQKHDGNKISRMINQKVQSLKKILQDIQIGSYQAITTSPVIKWAQSKQQIVINIKLSHRQDSPPCTDIKKEDFVIMDIPMVQCPFEVKIKSSKPKKIILGGNTQEKAEPEDFLTYFTYQGNQKYILGECVLTQQKLRFDLNMTFNSTIDRISIKKEGLGSYTIIGNKKFPEVWVTPFVNDHDSAIWPEMRNKFQTDMDEYFNLLDEKRQRQQPKLKRRRRRKNKEKAEQNSEKKQEHQENIQEKQKKETGQL